MASRTIQTPAGPFTFIAHGRTVLASGFTDDTAGLLNLVHPSLRDLAAEETSATDLDAIEAAALAYFAGDIAAIDTVDVHQRSGEFIDVAWKTLRQVPGGEPVTYTQLASDAGRPAAVRAAAQACARNAAALFVPCHRVVRNDGTLGGYRWGLDVKRWLIDHEATKETVSA
jgi:methylated-DNA-[protein]-cysteine S-methyltransferase